MINSSESVKELAGALVLFQQTVSSVKKDAKNPFFKSKYTSLKNILEAIRQPLAEAKLSFVQFPTGECGLVTRLMHASGEWMESQYQMVPIKNDPQAIGSAITYMRRYALSAILGLAFDEDDDGNAASIDQNRLSNLRV